MKKRVIGKKSLTDWDRVDAMKDTDIDFSDLPEITPETFAKAVVRRGLQPVPHKSQLALRVNSDVLAWHKAQGRGYQTRINMLLRAYMEANREQDKQGNIKRLLE